jgi:hypothetical protein
MLETIGAIWEHHTAKRIINFFMKGESDEG